MSARVRLAAAALVADPASSVAVPSAPWNVSSSDGGDHTPRQTRRKQRAERLRYVVHVHPPHARTSIDLRRAALGAPFHLPYVYGRDAAPLLPALFKSYSQGCPERSDALGNSTMAGQRFRKKRRVGSNPARSFEPNRSTKVMHSTSP